MEIKPHLSLIKTINFESNLYSKSSVRQFEIEADEPIDKGGQDLAPTPFDLLNSALASCTSIYLRNLTNKNHMNVGDIQVKIKIFYNNDKTFLFERQIKFSNELSEIEKKYLLQQSELTPTTIVLKKGNTINTTLK